MYKSVVYQGELLLGEVEIYPTQNKNFDVKEIKISHFSQPSERCPPLAVLHTITSSGICFKMESKTSQSQYTQLFLLHSSCIMENKTAVMPLDGEELHLVAMCSRSNDRQHPCFWGFSVASGLYNYSLVMLNLRCLGIVFDLDETLIVANTMRSFEDRIEALQRKINSELDPQRISGMLAEVKRYQDDKSILKQYVENDQVVENGKVIKVQLEIVPASSDNHQPIVRPLIRLHEANIILTRINPQIRDTSVLVRLRPAWEDLRSYLTARGRKRFEVYVCTMAERDYALEMWRLLDPDLNLINSKELLDRIVCVKSGLRKSLFNVFQNGSCHPKMALVIDDRLKVWDEKDQPRVHVVPAFAPYYAPQAEANNAIPVLCVARNVACNVRGGFFKEFDEGLLQKIPEIAYEDDIKNIPSPPDVGNYLVSEDDASATNGNKDLVSFDGMVDAEVERRLKDAISASSVVPSTTTLDPRLTSSLQYAMASSSGSIPVPTPQASVMPFAKVAPLVKPMGQLAPQEPSLHSSPAREEGEVPESELDPDTRRRLLILQHGQDTRDHSSIEPPFPVRPPLQVSVPRVQSQGGWLPVEEDISPQQLSRLVPKKFPVESEPLNIQVPVPRVQSQGGWLPVEEDMSPQQLSQLVPKKFPVDSEPLNVEKQRPHYPLFFPKVESAISSDRILNKNPRFPKAAYHRNDQLRVNHPPSSYNSFSGGEIPLSISSSSNRDLDPASGPAVLSAETTAGVLQEIAMKCGSKVEFKPTLVRSTDLQFSIETWFAGEKIGEGLGRTRREAQHQAAEGSLKNLANLYMSQANADSGATYGDVSRYANANDNGIVGHVNSFCNQLLPKEESLSFSTASEPSRLLDPRLEGSKKSMSSISSLKELCMMEGLGVSFQSHPPPLSAKSVQNDEVHAQAAERALGSLRSELGQCIQNHQGSPRLLQGVSSKRLRQEFPRVSQRIPSSARYAKNAPPVP